MQHLRFFIEGRDGGALSADEIRSLHRSGQVTATTRLSRDGKQWFPAAQLLNRMPDEEKPRPPTPVLR
ncbi:MAG: hypothetical protein SFW67_12420 [Myxococcaceae bacterium]|nr:hypothetical protein [Myxococcaceae bacterium]